MNVDDLIERAAQDILQAKYAIALTGAGMSTESGVRDFRGPDGIWTRNPDMERLAYEAYGKFKKNPKKYWEERLDVPNMLGDLSAAVPNPGHYALARLEEMGILKCLITQNIDNLHETAGSRRVLDYHGNSFKLRCVRCNARYPVAEYDLAKLKAEGRLPPQCKKCGGVLKEDIVHFHESIPDDVAAQSNEEALRCDLMLICGTSAVVYPFANLPRIARQRSLGLNLDFMYSPAEASNVTIIEVNVEPTPLTEDGISDYFIQGKTGEVLPAIVSKIERLQKII